jgi:hypothetical protein
LPYCEAELGGLRKVVGRLRVIYGASLRDASPKFVGFREYGQIGLARKHYFDVPCSN